MGQSKRQRRTSAVTVAVVGIVWASAAMSAPGSGKLCSLARDWVEGHCDGAKASRVATPARCARARDWLDAHCPSTKGQKPEDRVYRSGSNEDASPSKDKEERVYRSDARGDASPGKPAAERVYRSEARNDSDAARKVREDREHKAARYEPAPRRKHANKKRERVYVYAERPRSCCYSETVYYRTTPYRDQVFVTDHILRPGKEAAFFRAHEANMR
jgi:hypothetical protein